MNNQQRVGLGLVGAGCILAPILGGKLPLGNSELGTSLLDPSRATTAHSLIGLCLAIGLLVVSYRAKVIQVPQVSVWAAMMLWLIAMLIPLAWSDFRFATTATWIQWLSYGVAMLAVVAVAGRWRGPLLLSGCLLAGTAVVAAMGVVEYGAMRSSDPSWRVFSTWMNPNALAGMLLLALPVGLSLLALKIDRLVKILVGAALLLIGLCLILTQSKGGYAAAFVGLTIWLVLVVVAKQGKSLGVPLALVGLLVALTFAVQNASTTSTSAGALGRVSAAGGQAEQSVGFRQNLWKGAAKMVREHPIGYGLGTYHYESARSKLTTQTHLTHQGYLQMAVEGGALSLVMFLVFAVLWLVGILRGFRRLDPNRQLLLAGIIGSVAAVGAHNFIDSDWWHYGIGVSFFVLMGLALQLASDGSSPEILATMPRKASVLFPCWIAAIGLAYMMWVDGLENQARAALMAGDVATARSAAQQLAGIAPSNPEAPRILGIVANDAAEGKRWSTRLVELEPNTQNIRTLARIHAASGEQSDALRTLQMLDRRDPFNLPGLLLRLALQLDAEMVEEAEKTLNRMFEAEASPYVQVRAIPEIVPTEIAEARTRFALSGQVDAAMQVKLLSDALTIWLNYANTTVTLSMPVLKTGQGLYPGEDPDSVRRKLGWAKNAAGELKSRAQSAEERTRAGAAEAKFDGLLSELGGA